MQISDKDLVRFMSKVKFFDQNKCWEWSGYIRKDGYANFWLNSKPYLAHRFSYFIANSRLSKKMCVCHKCDNRKCVNPDHLWVGTQKDNMRDCARKGRIVSPQAEKTHCVNGHLLVGDNLYLYHNKKNGSVFRKCRACGANRARAYRKIKNAN